MRRALGGGAAWLVGFAFVGVMTTCILTIGIWPGEAKLLAPILCPADRSDAFVVSDTTNPRPGETVINYSLHCVGERGEVTEVGFATPFLLLSVIHGAILIPTFWLLGRRGKRRSAAAELLEQRAVASRAPPKDDVFVDSSTPGPFVD